MGKVALVQMTACAAVGPNLLTARTLIRDAAEAGAELVVLPENFALMGMTQEDTLLVKEMPGAGRIQEFISEQAAKRGVWIVAGTIPLVCSDEKRAHAACIVFNADGEQVACYRKIHMFDVHLPMTDETYEESAIYKPGHEIVVIDTPVGRMGMSICYDLRFPELYRKLRAAGAEFVVVPSAFTMTTGRVHWRPLLRARAIENQFYMLAPNQTGIHDNERATYGHSMVVSPWGDIIAMREVGMGIVVADIEMPVVEAIRAQFPVWEHRRLDRVSQDNENKENA